MKDYINQYNEKKKLSKEQLSEKANKILKELTAYKNVFNEDEQNDSNEYDSLFKINQGDFEFSKEKIDDDVYDVIKNVMDNDPVFALKFLERRGDFLDSEKYENLKKQIINKMK